MFAYYHIPKTAGTSFKRVLETWFPRRVMRDHMVAATDIEEILADPESCIAGHFAGRLRGHELSLLEMFPSLVGSIDHHVVTILREPLEHAVSTYYHFRDIDDDKLGSLEEFLERGHPFQYRRTLSVPSSEYIDRALSSFSFVGDTAQLQRSVDALADLLGKPRTEVSNERVGTRDAQVLGLSLEQRSRAIKLLDLDYEIYEAARDRLAAFETRKWVPRSDPFTYVEETLTEVEEEAARFEEIRWKPYRDTNAAESVTVNLSDDVRDLLSKKDLLIAQLRERSESAESRFKDLKERHLTHVRSATDQRNQLNELLRAKQAKIDELKSALRDRVARYKESAAEVEAMRAVIQTLNAQLANSANATARSESEPGT